MFWYAYSAWIRDVPSSEITTIFNEAVWPKTIENCNVKLEKAVFREIFETEYEGMSRLYESKILHYCDMYMNSEAGKALANNVEVQRRAGQKLPGISIEVLTKGYKGHPGIAMSKFMISSRSYNLLQRLAQWYASGFFGRC